MYKDKLLFFWYRYVGAIFRLFPINKKRILLENFFGKGYGDSPKYIAEELIRRGIEGVELIWLVKGNYYNNIPDNIKQVKRYSLAELYYLATSKIWIDNSRKHYGIIKRKKQYYIQTWHGGVFLKKIERDSIETLPQYYIKSAKHDSKNIDVLLSSSSYFTKIFRENFWYNGEILESGLPRSDYFFGFDNSSVLVKELLNIQEDCKIAFYAPTFRDNGKIDVYDMDYYGIIDTLEKSWGGKWCLIIRLHPNINAYQDMIDYSPVVINGSSYPDINHLIKACDLLITDYSSCMFDAIYANKKVILYASDLKEYSMQRGLYFKIEQLPFEVANNNDDMKRIIKEFDYEKNKLRVREFMEEIGSCEDGQASVKVADRIVELL